MKSLFVLKSICPIDGQVLHADAKLRVGQLARARHELVCGGERRVLRDEARGNPFADFQRFGERERIRARRARRLRRDSETKNAETSERARETPGKCENHRASDEQQHRHRQRRRRGSAAAK